MPEQFKPYNSEQVRPADAKALAGKDEAAKMSASAEAPADKKAKIESGEAKDYKEADSLINSKKPEAEIKNKKEKGKEFIIADLIDVPRIKIIKEGEDSYIVKCGKEEVEIIKGEETYFEMPTQGSASQDFRLMQTFEQKLHIDGAIFQNERVSKEFMEVMIFHEFREREYKEHDVENAHGRATNDEALYILKYFSPDAQKAYLRFAKNYRKKAQAKLKAEVLRKKREEKKKFLEEDGKKKTEEGSIIKGGEELKQQEELRRSTIEQLGLPREPSREQLYEIRKIFRWLYNVLTDELIFLSLLPREGVMLEGLDKYRFKGSVREQEIPGDIKENKIYKTIEKVSEDVDSLLDRVKLVPKHEVNIGQRITLNDESIEKLRVKIDALRYFLSIWDLRNKD